MVYTEDLNREDRMDTIYANADIVRIHDTKRNIQIQDPEGNTAGTRCSRLAAVCLGLLCVLLLSANTVLWLKFNNLNTERDQLQTSYTSLTIERDQLQTSYTNLTKYMDKLQKRTGWRFFSSSFYFISTEKKTWLDSRKVCTDKGADLVIIDRKGEQEFIDKTFPGTEAWIGLTDRAAEGVWKWVDNKTLTIGFWLKGEPNDFDNNEDCVVTGSKFATSGNVSTWADYPCSHPVLGICEILIQ